MVGKSLTSIPIFTKPGCVETTIVQGWIMIAVITIMIRTGDGNLIGSKLNWLVSKTEGKQCLRIRKTSIAINK